MIVERGKTYEKQPAPKNVIIEYERPQVCVDKQVCEEGVTRTDPDTYMSTRPCGDLTVVDKITDLPAPNNSIQCYPRSYTPANITNLTTTTTTVNPLKSKTSLDTSGPVAKGPASFVSPWNTTYRTSYTGKGFNGYRN